jgi:hypothetical protein
VYISPPERPQRLYKENREAIQDFGRDELLYLRYIRQHFVDGELQPAAIRSQLKQSVNRGRFSEPGDALFSETGKYNGLGVAEFRVEDIPARVEQPDGPAYIFFMWHEPLEDNYSHSEIWSDHATRTGGFRPPSRTVSLTFRIMLCRAIRQVRIEAER